MTKITELEASFEQYKEEQAAVQADAKEHRDRLQETMEQDKETLEKNKREFDQHFAEIKQLLKALQPTTTMSPPYTTVTPPPYTTIIPPYHQNQFNSTTLPPLYTLTMPPPYAITTVNDTTTQTPYHRVVAILQNLHSVPDYTTTILLPLYQYSDFNMNTESKPNGNQNKSRMEREEPQVDNKTIESLVPLFLRESPYPITWVPPACYMTEESKPKDRDKPSQHPVSSKGRKLPPVCLRIDPMPRKKKTRVRKEKRREKSTLTSTWWMFHYFPP